MNNQESDNTVGQHLLYQLCNTYMNAVADTFSQYVWERINIWSNHQKMLKISEVKLDPTLKPVDLYHSHTVFEIISNASKPDTILRFEFTSKEVIQALIQANPLPDGRYHVHLEKPNINEATNKNSKNLLGTSHIDLYLTPDFILEGARIRESYKRVRTLFSANNLLPKSLIDYDNECTRSNNLTK